MATVHSHHGMQDGLVDGCPRCAEHAEAPLFELDATQLRRLVAIAVDRERLSRGYSENDLIAAAQLLTQMERCGRLFELAPFDMADYLRERWHIDVRSMPRAPRVENGGDHAV